MTDAENQTADQTNNEDAVKVAAADPAAPQPGAGAEADPGLDNIADELAKEPVLPADGQQQEQPPAPAPETPPAPAPEPAAQDGLDAAEEKADPNADLRAEIRATLAAHLTDIDKRIDAFMEGKAAELQEDIDSLGRALENLEKAVAAATPEGAAGLLADVQATMADAKKVLADVQPMLEEFPKLKASIKHFL